MILVPYASFAEFKAYPTFLDLLNLRSGDTSLADQNDELNNVLLTASEWVDNYVELGAGATLTAHVRTEYARLRPDRWGRLSYHPNHIPVISVTSLAYGRTMGTMTTFTTPTVWIEDGRHMVADLQAGSSQWSGMLQLGPPAAGVEMYTVWTYIAGYPNTLLSASITAGATSLVVGDATGITPGLVMRVWNPGAEEAVTVASGYTTGTTIPLAAPTANGHTVTATNPIRVSAMGKDIREAAILYAIALLMRPDTAREDAFPDSRHGASTRLGDSRQDGSGLIFEAQHLLEPYRRIR